MLEVAPSMLFDRSGNGMSTSGSLTFTSGILTFTSGKLTLTSTLGTDTLGILNSGILNSIAGPPLCGAALPPAPLIKDSFSAAIRCLFSSNSAAAADASAACPAASGRISVPGTALGNARTLVHPRYPRLSATCDCTSERASE